MRSGRIWIIAVLLVLLSASCGSTEVEPTLVPTSTEAVETATSSTTSTTTVFTTTTEPPTTTTTTIVEPLEYEFPAVSESDALAAIRATGRETIRQWIRDTHRAEEWDRDICGGPDLSSIDLYDGAAAGYLEALGHFHDATANDASTGLYRTYIREPSFISRSGQLLPLCWVESGELARGVPFFEAEMDSESLRVVSDGSWEVDVRALGVEHPILGSAWAVTAARFAVVDGRARLVDLDWWLETGGLAVADSSVLDCSFTNVRTRGGGSGRCIPDWSSTPGGVTSARLSDLLVPSAGVQSRTLSDRNTGASVQVTPTFAVFVLGDRASEGAVTLRLAFETSEPSTEVRLGIPYDPSGIQVDGRLLTDFRNRGLVWPSAINEGAPGTVGVSVYLPPNDIHKQVRVLDSSGTFEFHFPFLDKKSEAGWPYGGYACLVCLEPGVADIWR